MTSPDVWDWSSWDKAPGAASDQVARLAPSLTFPLQEFGLARFKSNVTKSTKGFEYVLARMQGERAPKGRLGLTGMGLLELQATLGTLQSRGRSWLELIRL